jgi:hypothetical protein
MVKKHLVKQYGINKSRISDCLYGCYFPIADNATAAGRQKNRRTEVTITIRQSGEASKTESDEGAAQTPEAGEQR